VQCRTCDVCVESVHGKEVEGEKEDVGRLTDLLSILCLHLKRLLHGDVMVATVLIYSATCPSLAHFFKDCYCSCTESLWISGLLHSVVLVHTDGEVLPRLLAGSLWHKGTLLKSA
jgi:hypothetical protein